MRITFSSRPLSLTPGIKPVHVWVGGAFSPACSFQEESRGLHEGRAIHLGPRERSEGTDCRELVSVIFIFSLNIPLKELHWYNLEEKNLYGHILLIYIGLKIFEFS